ncbi:hypothetical protein BH24PSE2_BH24PSE2_08400 [soil metagenome]
MNPKLCLLAWCALTWSCSTPAQEEQPRKFDAGRVGFTLKAKEFETDYRVLGVSVMPGERLPLRTSVASVMSASGGTLDGSAAGWTWTAPKTPGVYRIEARGSGSMMRLNLFVLRPASDAQAGKLNGYRIGAYPPRPFRGLPSYRAPRGYIEVTPDMHDLEVSPHFTLKQFLCKQASDYPKYLVLREPLLLKLESILAAINAAGLRTDSFVIMSGYRTPWYNQQIGNRTASSRHLYGAAADIFIDVAPRDGVMDDLNGDGRTDKADADFLYDRFDRWSSKSWWKRHAGGLASYGATPAHGPFVHVDERGYKARWGR